MSNGQHAPSGTALSDEIEKILKETGESVAPEELHDRLVKTHPEWLIPERRVNKFLKRYLNEVRTESRSGMGNRLFQFFSPRRGGKKDEPLQKMVQQPEAAPEEDSTELQGAEKDNKSPVKGVAETIEEAKNVDMIYTDDNDGTKNDCECACPVM